MYSAIKEVPKDVRLEGVLEEVLEGVRGGAECPGQEQLLPVPPHRYLVALFPLPRERLRDENATTVQLSC